MAGEITHSSHSYSHLTQLPWLRTVVDTWRTTTGNPVEDGGRKQSRINAGKHILLVKFVFRWPMNVLYMLLSPIPAARLMAKLLMQMNAEKSTPKMSRPPTPQNIQVAEV